MTQPKLIKPPRFQRSILPDPRSYEDNLFVIVEPSGVKNVWFSNGTTWLPIGASSGGAWGAVAGQISDQTDLVSILNAKLSVIQVESAVAAAGVTDLSFATSQLQSVIGAAVITSFGVVPAGTVKYLRFGGVNTLTFNATSLITPTGANITTAAGDSAMLVSLGGGNWRVMAFSPAFVTASGGGSSTGIDGGTPSSNYAGASAINGGTP